MWNPWSHNFYRLIQSIGFFIENLFKDYPLECLPYLDRFLAPLQSHWSQILQLWCLSVFCIAYFTAKTDSYDRWQENQIESLKTQYSLVLTLHFTKQDANNLYSRMRVERCLSGCWEVGICKHNLSCKERKLWC